MDYVFCNIKKKRFSGYFWALFLDEIFPKNQTLSEFYSEGILTP